MFKAKRNIFHSELDKQIVRYRVGTQHRALHLDTSTLFQALEQQKEGGSITVCEGVIVGKQCIIFDQLVFTGEHIDLLSRLFSCALGDIYFIDCEFRNTFIQQYNILPDLFFRRCTFWKSFLFLKGRIAGKLCFLKCYFKGKLIFENTRLSSIFNIQDSWFEANSLFCVNKTMIDGYCKFCIKNTQFHGKFEVRKTEIHSEAKFENISFFNQFQIEELDLRNNGCVFKNFSFAHASSKDMVLAQSAFAKTLKENRYAQVITSLGLMTASSSNSSDDKEEREYQDALQKGWLNPKQAARFLGKSVRTLQEKRKNDQMQITKESLPFKGIGRDIVYPLDALKAHLEQDWNLLKELRKKHWKK